MLGIALDWVPVGIGFTVGATIAALFIFAILGALAWVLGRLER